MQVNSTSNVAANAVSSGSNPVPTDPTGQSLSQADFLKLLVAQMTSQDPMNPTSSQDILTQTVQLSTLQSNSSLQSTLAQLQTSQGLTQADSLLGRQVTVQADPTSNATVTGTVTGVDMTTGTPMILINGTGYDLSQLITISTAASTP